MNREEKRKKIRKNDFKPGSFAYVWNKISKRPLAMISLGVIAGLLILSFLSPYICKYDYLQINMKESLALPSWEHPFGCDEIGRDILARVLYGARYTMSIGIFATLLAVAAGVALGSVAGFFGGFIDNLLMKFLDVFQSFPGILLAITIATVLGPGYEQVIIAIAVSSVANYARMMRANILTIRGAEYIEAATSMNCTTWQVITRHIIPNAISPLIVQATMGIASAGLTASAISFLGFGVKAPTPEWGGLLSSARNYIRDYPHLCIFPGLFIMLSVLSYNLIGDAVRDALDPKLRD